MLHEGSGGGGPCGDDAPPAVAPGGAEDDLLEERADGGDDEAGGVGAAAFLEETLGGDAGVADLLGEVIRDGGPGVVAEVAGEAGHGCGGARRFDERELVVGVEAAPCGGAPAHEAEAPLGLVGVLEEASGVEDFAVEFVAADGGIVAGERGVDGACEFGLDALVGVE